MNRRLIEKLKFPESIRIPYFGGVSFRYFSKLESELVAKADLPAQPLNTEKRDIIVTASMTSFPARIEYVHLAIKSLMLQSYKPDRILLWLADEQFPDRKLPESLTELEKHGLEIRWCEDLCGHKRYVYCIREQAENEVLITFDDDIIYPIDCIKRLMAKHRQYPDCVVCERAQALRYKPDGQLENPGRWDTISDKGVKKPSHSLNPSPGAGCLSPYGVFFRDLCDETKIRELAFRNDDLWYMFMAAQNGTKIVKTRKYHKIFSLIQGSQTVQLATENVLGNKYMEAIDRLSAAYPQAWERICGNED